MHCLLSYRRKTESIPEAKNDGKDYWGEYLNKSATDKAVSL